MRFPCLCADGLFTVRERLRCSSRTTALLFANDRAALREQPRCSSRTANESIKRSREKRFICSGERQVIMYISSCNIVQIHIGLITSSTFLLSRQGQPEDNPGCPYLLIDIQCAMSFKDSRTTYSATLVLYGCFGKRTFIVLPIQHYPITLNRHPSTINRSSAA